MKKYVILAFLLVASSYGMQPSLSQKSEQLIQAIRTADVAQVKKLIENNDEFIRNYVRKFSNYGGYALQGAQTHKNDPALASKYLEIADFLKKNGADINENQFQALKKEIQSVARPLPTPVRKPAPPTVKPEAKPAAASATPVAVAKPPTQIKPTGGIKKAAQFKELYNLVIDGDYLKIKEYLESHDIDSLSPSEQEKIIASQITGLATFPGDREALLQNIRRIIKLLLNHGFKVATFDFNLYQRTRRGYFGSRGHPKSRLIDAIIKGNLAEIKQLIEREEYDPNEADSRQLSPLATLANEISMKTSTIKNAKEIALYLLSKGAKLYDTEGYYKKTLDTLGVSGY